MKKNKTEINNEKSNKISKPVTSPISQGTLVSKVNALTLNTASNPLLNPQNMVFNNEKSTTLNYKQVIDGLTRFSNVTNINDFYNKIYSLISQNIDSSFFAVGLFKEKSNCINLKLQDKLGNNFSTKVFLKDTENPIVEVFKTHQTKFVEKKDYLKLSYYKNYSTAILPMISVNKCIGVFIIEDAYARQNIALYSLIANYLALVTHNMELLEKSDEITNTDSLTLLANHRGFQEILTNEISRAEINKQKLSVIMMDINNITKINRELGHAKGDEVIKIVAEKVRQNVREGDIA